MVANGSKEFYDDDKNLMKLCDFLRSTEGPPVREAVEMDKRVYYIKGACLNTARQRAGDNPAGSTIHHDRSHRPLNSTETQEKSW